MAGGLIAEFGADKNCVEGTVNTSITFLNNLLEASGLSLRVHQYFFIKSSALNGLSI